MLSAGASRYSAFLSVANSSLMRQARGMPPHPYSLMFCEMVRMEGCGMHSYVSFDSRFTLAVCSCLRGNKCIQGFACTEKILPPFSIGNIYSSTRTAESVLRFGHTGLFYFGRRSAHAMNATRMRNPATSAACVHGVRPPQTACKASLNFFNFNSKGAQFTA